MGDRHVGPVSSLRRRYGHNSGSSVSQIRLQAKSEENAGSVRRLLMWWLVLICFAVVLAVFQWGFEGKELGVSNTWLQELRRSQSPE